MLLENNTLTNRNWGEENSIIQFLGMYYVKITELNIW